MAGFLQSVFVPHGKPKAGKIKIQAAPTEAVAAEGVADVTKSRQGRGLASTNLSGMRDMYNKTKLGSG